MVDGLLALSMDSCLSEELASSTPKRQRCAEQPTPENADCKKAELISIGVAFVQSMDERLEVIPRHCARGVGLHFKQLAQEVARAARLASVAASGCHLVARAQTPWHDACQGQTPCQGGRRQEARVLGGVALRSGARLPRWSRPGSARQ